MLQQTPTLTTESKLVRCGSRDEWKTKRMLGLTGTDAGIIAGVTRKYGSRYELYLKKTGQLVDVEEEVYTHPEDRYGPRYWGIEQEPILLKTFRDDKGLSVHTDPEWSIRRHPTLKWMLATPDGHVYDPKLGWGVLEIKTAGLFKESEWKYGRVPKSYLLQVFHYMIVMNYQYAWFAALIGGQKYRTFFIPRDDSFCEMLVAAEQRFWARIQNREPPEIDGHPATTQAVAAMHPEWEDEVTELETESLSWDMQRAKAIEDQEESTTRRAEAENKIKDAIGEAAYGILPNSAGRYSWKGKPRRLLRLKSKEEG